MGDVLWKGFLQVGVELSSDEAAEGQIHVAVLISGL